MTKIVYTQKGAYRVLPEMFYGVLTLHEAVVAYKATKRGLDPQKAVELYRAVTKTAEALESYLGRY